MKASYVIHTVGPIYRGGTRGEANILKSAYLESLKQAVKKGAKSVSFPAISAGVYGYPLNEAAHIALQTTIEYLKENKTIDLVRFLLFNQAIFDVFSEELQKLV